MSRAAARASVPSLLPAYLCLVALGSIVAHLASEFFAMGSDADSLALSPRHLYLGLIAVACVCALVWRGAAFWRASRGAHDLKRMLNVALDSLPWRGRGAAFFALTASLQLAFGLTTLFGEGCAFCGHDLAVGIIGALLTSVVLALAGRAIARRLPSIAAAIATLLLGVSPDAGRAVARQAASPAATIDFIWFTQLYNRPPPSLSIA
ncbi:MAG: hypothetical protein JO194_07475 [Candidatus Eremiobacteraeota bacterium]|nr:hypothetical protein [Candidatus Eremiobacteraeota bacterium]